ncbi:MAG: hypothetical protein ABIK28_12120 [Planctomycetota bacterium]
MIPGVPHHHLIIMDPNYLIAILFLIGLGIICILQSRHYKRMEKLTRENLNNQPLLNEIKSIRQSLETADFRRIIRLLEEMNESDTKVNVQSNPPQNRILVEENNPEAKLAQMIENHLTSQGYGHINLLAEMPECTDDPDIEYRVPLETHRDGVAFKGYLVIRNRCIVAERIKPAYEAFP